MITDIQQRHTALQLTIFETIITEVDLFGTSIDNFLLLLLPSQPQGITAHWLVPNYTAW